VNDGKAEIRDARGLWGKDIVETEDTLRGRLGDSRVSMCCIGPAGEKLSRIACPIVDKGNAPGRSGLGAIMGAQRLKAVVARGTMEVPVADPAALKALVKEARKPLMESGPLSTHGTSFWTYSCVSIGDCPTKNWAGGGLEDFPNAKAISDDAIIKYQTRKVSCRSCPIACNGLLDIKSGPYAVKDAQKPEYESLGALGAVCLNHDAESVILANDICNRYGLDTISVGCTIAFAMECYDRGLITRSDTDGIALTWGNPDAVVEMTWKIAKREGFGDVLADGSKLAAERIGKGSEVYAMHVYGQEVPMHDPRVGEPGNWPGILSIIYQADATPGRHTPTIENRGRAVRATGLCTFGEGAFAGERLCKLLTAATGVEFTDDTLEKVGERIACVRQAFNVREGIKPRDFKLPDRILGKPPHDKGPLKGITIDADARTKEYYERMNWSYRTGKPARKRLKELGGLDEVVADLYTARS
jgi:aldehyde:ferredoxin oxidoreductase